MHKPTLSTWRSKRPAYCALVEYNNAYSRASRLTFDEAHDSVEPDKQATEADTILSCRSLAGS